LRPRSIRYGTLERPPGVELGLSIAVAERGDQVLQRAAALPRREVAPTFQRVDHLTLGPSTIEQVQQQVAHHAGCQELLHGTSLPLGLGAPPNVGATPPEEPLRRSHVIGRTSLSHVGSFCVAQGVGPPSTAATQTSKSASLER